MTKDINLIFADLEKYICTNNDNGKIDYHSIVNFRAAAISYYENFQETFSCIE